MKTFLEIDEEPLRGAVVIIDIDGTLTHDKNSELEPRILEKVLRMGRSAHVYLSSNGRVARTRAIAQKAGVSFIDTAHRKPSRRVLENIAHEGNRRVVIGDKALTDGLFAVNIGAEFLPVSRIRHSDDSLPIRISY